jgi:hypothetical protein
MLLKELNFKEILIKAKKLDAKVETTISWDFYYLCERNFNKGYINEWV